MNKKFWPDHISFAVGLIFWNTGVVNKELTKGKKKFKEIPVVQSNCSSGPLVRGTQSPEQRCM